jgi:hypothetical protein
MSDTQAVQSPLQKLHTLKGAPAREQLEMWKQQACSGKLRIIVPDNRGFVLRGLSAREFETCVNEIPQNTPPEKVEPTLQLNVVIKATLWTNINAGNKLDENSLRNSPAGLSSSLYEVVCQLSDFYNPVSLQQISEDF